MWTSPLLFLTLIVTVFGTEFGFHNEKLLNLRSKLQDRSWNLGRSSLVAIADNSACNAIYSCSNCTTARICRPTGPTTFVEVKTIACPSNLPFCDYSTGTCTNIPDDSCGQTDDFICLQDGHFPDATSCDTYHVCDNYVAHKFGCNITGENYNPVSQQCENGASCTKFTCGNSGTKVPALSSTPSKASINYGSYFAYCDKTTGAPLTVDKCPGAYQLNSTSQSCEPFCDKEGVQADLADCQSYYLCSPLWVNEQSFLIKQKLSCPTGTGFDPNQFICVDLKSYPACKSSVEKKSKLIGGLNLGKLNL